MLKKLEEAEEVLEKAEKVFPPSTEVDRHRALIWALRQERKKALALNQGAKKPHLYLNTCVYAFLGMKEEAINNIRRGIEVGFEENQNYMYTYLLLKQNPCFDNLRDDPRFIHILNACKDVYDRRIKQVKELL